MSTREPEEPPVELCHPRVGQKWLSLFSRVDAAVPRTSANSPPPLPRQPGHATQEDLPPACDDWAAAQDRAPRRPANHAMDETGWFTAICRHGIQLCYADLICEGEGSKFSLACVSWALDVLRPVNGALDLCFGYDIGCKLDGYLKKSKLLKQKASLFRTQAGQSHRMGLQTPPTSCQS